MRGGAIIGAWLLLAGCSIDAAGRAGPDGGPDAERPDAPFDAGFDAGAPPDAGCHEHEPPALAATLDESAFALPEARHDGTAVEPPGVLVIRAQPYRLGALLARGYASALLGDSPAWSDLSGTPTGWAFVSSLEERYGGGDAPQPLLLPGQDQYTVAAEGEIMLPAGPVTVELHADDRALAEIDVGGRTERATVATAGSVDPVMFTVDAAGWYPIRVAYSDRGVDSELIVYLDEGGGRFVPGPAILRADVTAAAGREVFGFESAPPNGTIAGARIDDGRTDADYGGGHPPGVEIGITDGWSVRWAGRMIFDAADGAMRAATDGKHRLWVQGVYYGGEYGTGTADVTYPLRVAPGENDLVFELDDQTGSAFATLERDGAVVPADRLHPATRFGGVTYGAGSTGAASAPAGGTAETTFVVPAEVRSSSAVVEVSGVIQTSDGPGTTLAYEGPDGRRVSASLDEWGETVGTGAWVFRAVGSIGAGDASGEWRVLATSTGSAPVTLAAAGVLLHDGADPEPYAAEGVFVSAPADLGVRSRVTSVELDAYTLFGTSVALEVNVSDDWASPTPWWFPVLGDGTVDGPAVGQYLFVRARLRGARVDTPRVVEIRAEAGACLE